MGRGELAGAAHLQLVSGVVQLRPQEAMFEAMVRGWRAQQTARGLHADTVDARERLVAGSRSSPTSIRGSGDQPMWTNGQCG
jgi:hypothetical protein